MPDAINSSLHELLLDTAISINSEMELQPLVQRITDIGTKIIGARFGAFFYNAIDQKGEAYQLYTISGVPREAFSKFPMPRNTAVFHPTFAGDKIVRYDDVTQQSHYGQEAPYFGMPKGHLPVKSYLAAPVVSPATKEVIGGLFFGHETAGVFSDRDEKLIEGIAAQAAIAVSNAKLFEEKRRTEDSLREQKEQYKSIFQSTTDAMIILGEDGKLWDANMAAVHLFGYTEEELRKIPVSEIFSSDSLFNAIRGILDSGRQFQSVTQVKTAAGNELDVKVNASSYQTRLGTRLLLVLRRLDSDRQIEEALFKSEAFAETIANVSPVTLWMTNDKAEAIYVNKAWIEMVGGSAEDQLGSGWLNAIIPEDRESAGIRFMDSFNNKKVFHQDFRIRRRDGVIRWCSTYGSPYYLPDGTFGGFAGSLTDITERKATEDQLASQNNLIRTITNNTFHALFLMDDRQHCTFMNPAAEQMIGFKVHEVRDKPLHYYIHHTHPDGRHFPIEDCPIDRALPTRMQTTGEDVFIRKNGEFFPVAFVASPIIENGIPKGTVIEVRETSEEKRIQEELRNKEKEAMAMLEQKVQERTAELEKMNYELMQFTSVASHDLKEPVRKVSIFSQRAKELAASYENSQFHHFMDSVIRSSQRMALLIDDLLAFARISHSDVNFEEINLNRLLDHIRDDLQLTISEKNASIEAGDLPTVWGIELQLGQVFQNLISNSLKFVKPERHPVITIQARLEGAWHIIDYTDNGIGFDNSMSDRIFDVFERLHSRDKYEGTGIGLSIVKKIISLHGGKISASGSNGEGARFEIKLPVKNIQHQR